MDSQLETKLNPPTWRSDATASRLTHNHIVSLSRKQICVSCRDQPLQTFGLWDDAGRRTHRLALSLVCLSSGSKQLTRQADWDPNTECVEAQRDICIKT